MRIISKSDLQEWDTLLDQLRNGYHLSDSDKHELIRLNHLIIETSHDIHNINMIAGLEGIK